MGVNVKLNFEEFRDKVYACWIGKNIGGTIGAPYEGTKEYMNVTGFATKAGEVLPNDDLDLQLVWLAAVERCGVGRVDAATLGEFWLSFIGPHWNEYGVGKANMKMGLLPPLSGDYRNDWKHSNGAWIRTEIWACLNPGRPDIAAKCAIEDACVDHGTGEGTYAAIFVAALQSAAFVIGDLRTCIEIALSKIPSDCRMASSVRLTMECYDKGLSPKEARNTIQKANADIGDGWFEAPSNVSYVVLGLLYGEGDFKKSMLYAVNCGDDTDCTAATVGATMGILYGTKGIPVDWSEHIGDEIVTLSIDKGTLWGVPKTCTELTERVVVLAKLSVAHEHMYPYWNGEYETVELTEGETVVPADAAKAYCECPLVKARLLEFLPNSFTVSNDYVRATVAVDEGVDIAPNTQKKIRVIVNLNNDIAGAMNIPGRLRIRWWLPDGYTVEGRESIFVSGYQPDRRADGGVKEEVYLLNIGEYVSSETRVVAEITGIGHVQSLYLPIVLIG
ncbi:MAG: ADP-ribosylglycohydrolase family protein [Ruminococcaceae bacterium]|nr:ADP-ribosylglycohydrolase family protein [Oscillospiraceae bacterium]